MRTGPTPDRPPEPSQVSAPLKSSPASSQLFGSRPRRARYRPPFRGDRPESLASPARSVFAPKTSAELAPADRQEAVTRHRRALASRPRAELSANGSFEPRVRTEGRGRCAGAPSSPSSGLGGARRRRRRGTSKHKNERFPGEIETPRPSQAFEDGARRLCRGDGRRHPRLRRGGGGFPGSTDSRKPTHPRSPVTRPRKRRGGLLSEPRGAAPLPPP